MLYGNVKITFAARRRIREKNEQSPLTSSAGASSMTSQPWWMCTRRLGLRRIGGRQKRQLLLLKRWLASLRVRFGREGRTSLVAGEKTAQVLLTFTFCTPRSRAGWRRGA